MNLKSLEVLVLDEADSLLDLGFQITLNQILGILPKQRRTGLFSATQTKEVKELARAGMRNPVSITVRVQPTLATNANTTQSASGHISTPSTLSNWYVVAEYDSRPGMLANFFVEHRHDKIIVFLSSCACVDYFSAVFSKIVKDEVGLLPSGLTVIGFHGKMVPKKRNALYQKFVSSPSGVLFCTDVAARGVDIPDVDWIVQMAAPKDPAFFIHRIGRTARAGSIKI
jgi:ATP-dependent RNA helicase DDX55/SPB4